MYNPDDKTVFTPLKEKRVDEVTELIYKQKKMIYGMVKHNMDKLNPKQKKHFTDIGVFIEGYESGVIKHWQEFFETPEKYVARWNKMSPEENKKEIERVHRH